MRIYNCEMDTGCLKKFPCLAKAARHGASLVKLEKRLPKIECGPRASHPRTASFVCSCPGTVYRGGGDMNATASIFPRGALHVLKLGLSTRDRAITNLEPLRCKQLCLALKSKTGGGGRNARATSLRLRAILEVPLGDSLSRITAAARSPQSSGRARNYHVSLEPNFFQFVAGRNTKKGPHCEQTVDDETSLWKVEENLELFVA